MNERIKELAEQAMRHTNSKTGEVYRTHFQFEERFAELIIKECLEEIDDTDLTRLEGPDPEDVIWLVTKHLKEHFGIE